MGRSYYHVSSHGLERNDIFKSKEDFIQGMNDVAMCVLGYDVMILAFCLMSNHFHFVLMGTFEECRLFAEEYKRRSAIRMRSRNGDVQGLRKVQIQLDELDTLNYLENAIAYVLRNSLAAGIPMMPYHYPWSSASLYFQGGQPQTGERLCDMSERKRFRILKTRIAVPDTYAVNADGMILPSCYVDVSAVENLFRSPARLLYMLSKKVENEVELQLGVADHVTMTDQEIMTQIPNLIKNEFGRDNMEQLTMEQRIKLCLLLKRNYRENVKQIARLTRLSTEVVCKVV